MLMAACALVVSCNWFGENETEAPADTEGSTDVESGSDECGSDTGEDESGNRDEDETYPDIEGVEYENGASIANAGNKWDEEVFADTVNTIDESKAVTKTAAEILALLVDKDLMAEGEVYRVTEPIVLESGTKYYGNLAAVIAEGGIVIKDASKIVIKELVVKGNITVENSDNITFFKLDLQGGDVAARIDASSKKISFKSCQVRAADIAIKSDADTLSVFQNHISAANGIVSTGDNFSVQDTRIEATTVGVSSSGNHCTVKNCLVKGKGETVGISFEKESKNGLIALNVVDTAQNSINLTECFNCVVLLNSAVKVNASNSKNIYVCENKLGGAITLENNKYVLCDANSFPNDDKPHPVINKSNTEYNGNNLHNVNERVEYGANEELLPHTNRDLFLDMERHSSVTDISLTKSYSLSNYIRTISRQKSIVIVPPGAYTIDTKIQLEVAHANTTVYGYGVYIEKNGREFVNNDGALSQDGTIFAVYNSQNVTVKGVTFGYNFQSAGQIHILEKLENYRFRVIGNAGYVNDFYQTDNTMFSSSIYCYKKGEFRPWFSLSGYAVEKDANGNVIRDEDGAFIISIASLNNADPNKIYKLMEVGDIFACRLSADNSQSISLQGSNILMKDCVLYGYSSALGIKAGSRSKGVRLERLHNTAHSQPVIDQATYEKYLDLEKKYKVDLEVSIDEENRYRGGFPRQGSVDATHIMGASEGVSATSCTFELMCDDGSNQRGSSSRIAGYRVNDDGTTTIYFKGTISQTHWNINTDASKTSASPTNTTHIKKDDRVYAYASNGRVLFDTTALTEAKPVTYSPDYHLAHVDKLDNSKIKEGDITDLNGNFTKPSTCVDGLCDICGDITHYDCNRDGKCDLCQTMVHVDLDHNGKCDVSGCRQLVDENDDGIDDKDGLYIITDRFHVSSYNTASGQMTMTAGYNRNGWRTITYTTTITEINVKTSDVNFEAFEGYDLDDNEYLMDNKILIDNISANSVGFTFDNVLIQNKNARGILGKTHDIVIKNCTFRGFSSTGVLLSVETTWGESTVPRNVLVERCLFDDTGRNFNTESNTTYSCIAIQGLGANSSSTFAPSEDTLPCRDIRIIGNKFINQNNYYAISISAAQDIVVKDNVFEGNPAEDTEKKFRRAIYIDGAMNIEISGNTFSDFTKDVTKAVIGWNYKNLTGTDVEEVLPTNKDPKPAT